MSHHDVTLPDDVDRDLERQMRIAGFDDLSSYLEALLRADRKRLVQEKLESALREGFESGHSIRVTDTFFEELREEFLRRYRERESARAVE
jgi:antitoxin ParD1/3/4